MVPTLEERAIVVC